MAFREQLCSAANGGDIRTEMAEYEICFLTSDLNHFRVYFNHVVGNTGEDRCGCTCTYHVGASH